MKEKASLFIDASNFFYVFKGKDWKVDYKKFINCFSSLYNIVCAYYYEGMIIDNILVQRNPEIDRKKMNIQKNTKREYSKHIRSFGYKVIEKPISSVYDQYTGRMVNKCNFDVELTINAIQEKDNFDIFILCSGDGDFVKLLKYMKGQYKKTIIVSSSDRLNENLKKTANKCIF